MKIKTNNIEDIVSEVKGISFVQDIGMSGGICAT